MRQNEFQVYAVIIFTILFAWGATMFIGNYFDKKDYPIEVLVKHGYNCLTFEADSVRGDTIYKDSVYVVNKNIVNVVFE